MTLIVRSLILAVIAGAVLAPAAHASSDQSSIMMDDDLLVYRGPDVAKRSMQHMKQLGADTIRVTLLWSVVGQKTRFTKAEIKRISGSKARAAARKQTRRFRASSPKTYPQGNWDAYDNIVRIARSVGLRVYFNVTGPGPRWAHRKPPRRLRALRKTYKPNPRQFKLFTTAAGKRYSGAYADENQGKTKLPRVSMWSLWNEPNQAGWLSPQWERIRGAGRVMVSPVLFRRLHQQGYRGLAGSGHTVSSDIILLAETAPQGSAKRQPKSPPYPKSFLRELACLKSNGKKYRGRAAKARSCNRFGAKLRANGFAHHPYTKNVPTTTRHKNKNALTMANISELGDLLDSLSKKSGGRIPDDLPLWMTEFGFETNPPDPFNGVSLAEQARYNQLGELLAMLNPRIAAQAQFLLRDVAPVAGRDPDSKGYWFTYQSGLQFENNVLKPAGLAYRFGFLAFPGAVDAATGRQSFSFWGQARFLPDGATQRITIQWRQKGTAGAWQDVGPAEPINQRGYFQTTRLAPQPAPSEWRAILRVGTTVLASSLPTTG